MHNFVDLCPLCKNEKVESIPISFDETYKFDYDAGVELYWSLEELDDIRY